MKELSVASQVVTPSPIREMFNRAIGMEDVVSFTVGAGVRDFYSGRCYLISL